MPTPFFTTEQLGPSQHLTPEGFLVISNVPLARTGPQLYSEREVPVKGDSSGRVIIDRDADEVFRDQTIASLHGKPITIEHPSEDVTPENYRELSVGHVVNPHRGQGVFDNLLLGDLVITDPAAIKAIRSRQLREVSVGYVADYEDTGQGRGRQRNIQCNHLALVRDGRCGPVCRIGDKAYYTNDQEVPIPLDEDLREIAEGQPPNIVEQIYELQEQRNRSTRLPYTDSDRFVEHDKKSVDYTPLSPDEHERCGNCHHWLGKGGCDTVTGEIAADGWCKLFELSSTTHDWSFIEEAGKRRLRKKQNHIHLHI